MNDNNFEEYSDYDESEDLQYIRPDIISQAVLSGNDWTTETIISQINKGNIILDPKFQRRDAWDNRKKSNFIESLFLGLPIPQLVLAESKTKKGNYIVIDGKQRLLALRQFISSKNDKNFNQLKLNNLSIRKDLNGKTFETINSDLTFTSDISAFENQSIRTVVVRNWKSEDLLYSIFLRLNTGSVPLSPQELRQALHPGKFIDFVDNQSIDSQALKEILKNNKPDFRMRDVELLIRYYSYKYFLKIYSGNLKHFLDTTCMELNDHWDQSKDRIYEDAIEFEKAYDAVKEVFGYKNSFRKWIGDSYQNRFNRAIFDIMIFYFSFPDFRQSLLAQKEKVESTFKSLCSNNELFVSSLERTTKSIESNYDRFTIWSIEINKNLNINLPEPKLVNNRIIIELPFSN